MKDKAAEEKNTLKRRRIKMFFLEAAREIIVNEGYERVSARRVADMAGYSYATIYNYFTDLNEMLWEVKELMIADLFEVLQKNMRHEAYDIGEIKKGLAMYVEYYFQNPKCF